MHPTASHIVMIGIGAVVFVSLALFIAAAGRVTGRPWLGASLSLAWVALTGVAAASGVLARFDARPPPLAALMGGTLALGFALGLSPLGRKLTTLPWAALIGAQAFRLPLELLMHRAATEGTMPNALSFSGYNFDIVLGASSILVAWLVRREERRTLITAWNLLGTFTLLAIAVIAVLTAPMLQALGPNEVNTWVAYVPFVWVPAVCVVVALVSHVVAWRKWATGLAGEHAKRAQPLETTSVLR